MKAKQVKAERTIVERQHTCIVCGTKTKYPYGLLRHGKCVCSRPCNDKYLKGDYRHDR
jgi:galactose-1-phosphate uridylyltransferase